MRILKLTFLKDYKQFSEGTQISFSDNLADNFSTYSFLAGKNGSGKTTAMSIIAQLFHNIERYHNRIGANIELLYSIRVENNPEIVTIKLLNDKVFVSVKDKFENKFLRDNQAYLRQNYRNYIRRKVKQKDVLSFNLFRKYLPSSITASVFSIHGEWPNLRPPNYTGLETINVYDISSIYGYNHYDLPSITPGISRFLELFYNKTDKLNILLKQLDLEFSGRIKINRLGTQNKRWINITPDNYQKYIKESENEDVYFNDIEFIRFDKKVCLDNMSSGEKMLMIRLLSILSSIQPNGLVFIEEPELHLDQIWKRQLISFFKTLFSEFNAHFIISTHSPTLINTVPKEQIVFLENGKVKKITFNTFLIDDEVLFQEMYSSEFKFNSIEQEVLDKISSFRKSSELSEFIETLGDSFFRLLALKKLKTLK